MTYDVILRKTEHQKMFQFFWDPKSGQTGVLPGQSQINFVRLSLQFWLQIYQKKTPPSGADLKMLYKKLDNFRAKYKLSSPLWGTVKIFRGPSQS